MNLLSRRNFVDDVFGIYTQLNYQIKVYIQPGFDKSRNRSEVCNGQGAEVPGAWKLRFIHSGHGEV